MYFNLQKKKKTGIFTVILMQLIAFYIKLMLLKPRQIIYLQKYFID